MLLRKDAKSPSARHGHYQKQRRLVQSTHTNIIRATPGGGTLDAAPELRDFVARTGIPVVSTLMGLGTFPGEDPLSLQMLGMHGTVFANYAVDQVRLTALQCIIRRSLGRGGGRAPSAVAHGSVLCVLRRSCAG